MAHRPAPSISLRKELDMTIRHRLDVDPPPRVRTFLEPRPLRSGEARVHAESSRIGRLGRAHILAGEASGPRSVARRAPSHRIATRAMGAASLGGPRHESSIGGPR